jgi:hypothetical protein
MRSAQLKPRISASGRKGIMTRPTLMAVVCGTLIVGALVAPPFSLRPALACVVGTGSGTCTESTLNACLPGGGSFDGTVTFNCGGAATITVTSPSTISADTTIDGGSLITIGGGSSVFYVNSGVNFTIQNLTIANSRGGTGPGWGGGGIVNSGTLTITNSTFSGNSAVLTGPNAGGGGCIGNFGTVTVTNSTFSGNSANTGGGGGCIANNSGTVTVTNSTFSGNIAGGSTCGGAISNGGTLTVTNSTFSGNSTDFVGSGICNEGTVTVTNSTFSGNSGGGGIYNQDGTVTVTNSTLSGNTGGGILNNGGTTSVTNTIVANSTSGGNCYNAFGAITDGGHNIDDGTTCGFTGTGCTSTTGTSFCNTNAVLDPSGLQNNGGLTQTIALQVGSPAINAGDESVCSATTGTAPVDNRDQRGYVRPGTGATNCSIGAFEANGRGFVPPDTNTGKCEDTVAGKLQTLAGCVTNCQIKQADAARKGKAFDEDACEQGTGKPVSCRTAYDNATTKLLGLKKPICPPCLDATAQSNLADLVVNFIENNNGLIYCAGTTSLGGDDTGLVPPDAKTGNCEDLVAGHLKTLSACMTTCQIKQADAARKGKAFDEDACEQGTGKPVSCRTAYDNATTKLLGLKKPICPPCLDATAQSNLADLVVNLVENNNGQIYCAGTTPLP